MTPSLTRCLVAAFAAALLTSSPAHAQSAAVDDLVGRARAGWMMCVKPDSAQRRCHSTARYSFSANGAIRNHSVITMNERPVIVMTANFAAVQRGRALCGQIRAADLDAATFHITGRPANDGETALFRTGLRATFAVGQVEEHCVTLTPEGDGARIDISVDGVPKPDLSEPMIWVRPNQGYTVSP